MPVSDNSDVLSKYYCEVTVKNRKHNLIRVLPEKCLSSKPLQGL